MKPEQRESTIEGLRMEADAVAPGFDPAEFKRLWIKLVAYFRNRRVWNPEDLAADVLLRALTRLIGGAVIPEFPNYCFGVAQRVLMEYRRAHTFDPLPAQLAAPPGGAEQFECEHRIAQALAKLPEEEARNLRGYYLGDKKELAKSLGITEPVLRLRVHRIAKKLRQILGTGEDGCDDVKRSDPDPASSQDGDDSRE